MRDELLDFYGDLYMALRLVEVGVSFEEFLAGPVLGVLSARKRTGFPRWAGAMSLSATALASPGQLRPVISEEGVRRARLSVLGEAEHARHDRLARRFMAGRV